MPTLVRTIEVHLIENSHGRQSRSTFQYRNFMIKNDGTKIPLALNAESIVRLLAIEEKTYSWPHKKPIVSQVNETSVNVTYIEDSTE